ncbi:MAG: CorA family divalent cation transporter [Candidatus Anstonellales archaeon]
MDIYRVDKEINKTTEYRLNDSSKYILVLERGKDDVYGNLTQLNIDPLFIQDTIQEDVIKYENIDELSIFTLLVNTFDIQNNSVQSYQFSIIIRDNIIAFIVDNLTREYVNRILKIYTSKRNYSVQYLIYLTIHSILTDNIMILDYLESKFITYERNLSNLSALGEVDYKQIYQIFDIKDALSVLKRQSILYREVFVNIKNDIFNQDSLIYYEDLVDRSNMLSKDIDILNDRIQNFVTQMLLIMNFSAAEATKLLSAISAIFLPMSVVAGIYGMNFANMPELEHPMGYYFALLMIIISGVISFYIMKKKRYI